MRESYSLAELTRIVHNMLQVTTITSVDHSNRKVRVRIGGDESAELPWPADIGRNWVRWKPLREGQQVVIACPSGDPAQAVIIGDLYSNAIDTSETAENLDVIEFENGNRIQHDVDTGAIHITVNDDVYINDIPFLKHLHSKVRIGTEKSGEPTT
jgi:phage baseplate assembly protein V